MNITQRAETSTKTHFLGAERVSCWRERGVECPLTQCHVEVFQGFSGFESLSCLH